ncbi:MAG: ABC transporter ATP-binding protein [Bacilli bacterium]
MIEVKNLSKKYGSKTALDDINFTVNDGEILGFLGPNGAGKSTTMNIITGYISSTEGTVTVDGDEIMENPIAVKRKIGYLPEQPPLYLDMTVKAYLSFMYDLKKVKLSKTQHIEEICKVVKIDDVYNRIIKHLSKGYKQRVGIAQALLGDPKLLILDEPTVGLDPNQIIEIRNLIKSLGEKHTIILSSHVLSEIQTVCNRVIVINKGKVVADDTTANLSSGLSAENRLLLSIEGDQNAIISALKELSGVKNVKLSKTNPDSSAEYVVNYDKNEDVRKAVFAKMAEINCPIISMSNDNMTLEDIFRKLTDENNIAPEASKTENGGEK